MEDGEALKEPRGPEFVTERSRVFGILVPFHSIPAIFLCLTCALSIFLPNTGMAFSFSPNGCEYKVEFKVQPEISSVFVPEIGSTPEAQISDNSGLMRANCIGADDLEISEEIAFYSDKQLLLSTIQSYSEQNGLLNTSYTHERTPLGVRAGARGTKQIDGRWFTYEIVWYVSPRSVLSLVVGHLSEYYPTSAITSFLGSVSWRTQASNSPQSSFVNVQLPFEVSIDLPRNWWILNETMNNLIHTTRDAVLDLRGISIKDDEESLLIAANSWPPITYAALRVTRVYSPLGDSNEIRHLGSTDLSNLRDMFEAELMESLEIQGLQYIRTVDIHIEEIDESPAIIFFLYSLWN